MSFFIFIFLNIFFCFIFLIYFCLITVHFCRNLGKKASVYWWDLWLLNILICSFVLIYLTRMLSVNKLKEQINNTYPNTNYILQIVFFIIILIGVNNLLQNIFKSLLILFSKRSIISDLEGAYEVKRRIDDEKIFNRRCHLICNCSLFICDIISVFFFITREDWIETILNTVKYVLFIVLFLSLMAIILIYSKMKRLEEIDPQRCYDQQKARTLVTRICIDFMIHKILLDVMFNIPHLLILLVQSVNEYMIIINYLVWFVYILFMTNLLFLFDKNNRIKITSFLSSFFFSKFFFFKLGSSSGLNINSSNKYLSNQEDGENDYTVSNLLNREASGSQIEALINNFSVSELDLDDINLNKKEKDYMPVNFFIAFKLLYSYYKNNEKVYDNYEYQINHVSLLGKSPEVTNFNTNLTLSFEQIFNNIEDRDMKEQFERISPIDNTFISENVCIDSLFTEHLLELYPFYQVCCKDIINSLETEKNKIIFKILFEKKYTEKDFNYYFTRDTFLHMEIYESSALDFIEHFIQYYKEYIKDRYTQWRQTFLPLILGVFNIRYLDYNKIVVLYRHPLAFSPFLIFKYWINLTLGDLQEKVSISTNFTEVIDVKEIEIKDNICLHKDDHKDVIECLNNDFEFLSKVSSTDRLDFSLNIFIINEIKNFLSSCQNNFSKLLEEDDSKFSREILNQSLIRKTDLFRETTLKNIEKSKKDFGSEVTSPLDKLVTNYVLNSRYVIKIYFSGLFNLCQADEGKHHLHMNVSTEEHNRLLAAYIKTQIEKVIKVSDQSEQTDVTLDREYN